MRMRMPINVQPYYIYKTFDFVKQKSQVYREDFFFELKQIKLWTEQTKKIGKRNPQTITMVRWHSRMNVMVNNWRQINQSKYEIKT